MQLPPVDIRSSITTTFCPRSNRPSIRFVRPWSLAPLRTYPIGRPSIVAVMAACAMPAVDVPISTSHSGKWRFTNSASPLSTSSRTAGADSVSRLSQYIGLLIPLAHVNGCSGRRNTAPIDSRSFAISLSISTLCLIYSYNALRNNGSISSRNIPPSCSFRSPI